MEKYISIVIPNYNGSATIGKCLTAAFSSRYGKFEVVVVDDCSTDNSIEIIRRFPCKLIQLDKHSGTARARNEGAYKSKGEILFFIDADCLLHEDTLAFVNKAIEKYKNDDIIIGGTYTQLPYDDNFFSIFQSIFVNYFEKKKEEPDYIAAHALIIDSRLFKKSGGFSEDFLPILEDVEFSHRLRKSGCKLVMNPDISVQHIFNFTLMKSLKNALRKSMFWTMYSLKNRDLFKDSGTASVELKINVVSYFFIALLAMLYFFLYHVAFLKCIPLIIAFNLFVNRRFLKVFYDTKGSFFAITASLYYTMLYPIAIGTGALAGIMRYFFKGRY